MMKLVKARLCLWKICEFWPYKKFRVNGEQCRFLIRVVRKILQEKRKFSKDIPRQCTAELYFLLLIMCNEIQKFSNSSWEFKLTRPSSLCLALRDYFQEIEIWSMTLKRQLNHERSKFPSMEVSRNLLPSLCEKDTNFILEKVASRRDKPEFKKKQKATQLVNLAQIVLVDKTEGSILWTVFANDIKIVKILADGHARDVFEVEWMGFGYCMKRYKFDYERARRRAEIQIKMHHPGIVQAYGVLPRKDEGAVFCVLMELLVPESFRSLRSFNAERKLNTRKDAFSNLVLSDILVQIARAMRYLHAEGFVHGDLNPNNVILLLHHGNHNRSGLGSGDLLKSCGFAEFVTVKITGFGESKQASGDHEKAADIYDFGITAFEVVSGIERPRLWLKERERERERGGKGFWEGFRHHDPFFVKLNESFLAQCLSPVSDLRPSFEKICDELLLLKSQELHKVLEKKQGLHA